LEPVTTPDLMPVDVPLSDSEQPERLGSRRATIAGVSVAAAVVIGAFVALLRLSPAADPAAPPSTSTASSALAVPGVTPTSRRVTSTSRPPSPTPSASPAPSATPEESATPTGEPTRSAPVKTKPPPEPSAIVSISRSPTPGQSRQP
jgi:hypothetical protein